VISTCGHVGLWLGGGLGVVPHCGCVSFADILTNAKDLNVPISVSEVILFAVDTQALGEASVLFHPPGCRDNFMEVCERETKMVAALFGPVLQIPVGILDGVVGSPYS